MANGNIVLGKLSSFAGRTVNGLLELTVEYHLTRATANGAQYDGETDADFLATVDPTQTDTDLLTDVRTQLATWCTSRYGEQFDVTDIRGCSL